MPPKIPASRPSTTRPKTTAKQFQIETWDGTQSGEKIILVADSGMGKTTLSAMAPNPVFIGLDDGGRKILHPQTGERLRHITNKDAAGNEIPFTFADVRAALTACLELDCETVVIDTITILEHLALEWTLKHVAGPKGASVVNIESYGYNKGYRHLYDTMRLPLLDCDKLVAAGKNVIAIAQSINHRVANPSGEDFLCAGPRLYNGKPSIVSLWNEWADHILRIGYQNMTVSKEKKAAGDTTRLIYAKPEVHFMAKSRTLESDSYTFNDKSDDCVWQHLFAEKGE